MLEELLECEVLVDGGRVGDTELVDSNSGAGIGTGDGPVGERGGARSKATSERWLGC